MLSKKNYKYKPNICPCCGKELTRIGMAEHDMIVLATAIPNQPLNEVVEIILDLVKVMHVEEGEIGNGIKTIEGIAKTENENSEINNRRT